MSNCVELALPMTALACARAVSNAFHDSAVYFDPSSFSASIALISLSALSESNREMRMNFNSVRRCTSSSVTSLRNSFLKGASPWSWYIASTAS